MIEPAELYAAAWKHLLRATADKKHAFRTPSISTAVGWLDLSHPNPSRSVAELQSDGVYLNANRVHARSRRVVLRKAVRERDQLWLYTDRRSAKMEELAVCGGVLHWLFWDPKSSIQMAGSGHTRELGRKETGLRFNALEKHSRKAYATLRPPGTPLPHADDGLPVDWDDLSHEQTDYARENFTILVTELWQVDILQLGREGHRRVIGRKNFADWTFEWVVP